LPRLVPIPTGHEVRLLERGARVRARRGLRARLRHRSVRRAPPILSGPATCASTAAGRTRGGWARGA